MTWILAILGLGLMIWGLVIFIAFGVATAALNRFQKTKLYTRVQETDTVRNTEAFIGQAIEMIPSAFVRRMVTNQLGNNTEHLAFSVAINVLKGRSRSGIWLAAGGFALFFGSFFIGPRLSQAIGG